MPLFPLLCLALPARADMVPPSAPQRGVVEADLPPPGPPETVTWEVVGGAVGAGALGLAVLVVGVAARRRS
ncbi:MAG: hypothetical protein H6737_23340 [Alphaproteobacteria bacterium]|nr:hypothetical protein [Alphaproteobacteria bacterium]